MMVPEGGEAEEAEVLRGPRRPKRLRRLTGLSCELSLLEGSFRAHIVRKPSRSPPAARPAPAALNNGVFVLDF